MNNIERYVCFMSTKYHEVQTFRTEQGTEYASSRIDNYLRVNGITHVLTGRAVHAQMHVAERINRTITEISHTMLLDAGLSKCWLGYAVLYTTMVRNSCTTSTINNKETP